MMRKVVAVGKPFMVRNVASTLVLAGAVALAGCGDASFVQRESPTNAFKDYKDENLNNSAVIGIGKPISSRQMKANATISVKGDYDLDTVMEKVAGNYNVAIRWGAGVRRSVGKTVVINALTFDEARSYIEDVFDVQIIREGDRRLLVMPSASEPRLKVFNPGDGVTLAQAIKGLAEQCSYNLVISDNKAQLSTIRVTSSLKNVTCSDAFDALLNPHGLSLVNEGEYYTVGGLPQRQWSVELYEPERTEELEVNASSDFSSAGSEDGGSTASAGGRNTITISYERNLWQDLQQDLQGIIDASCDPRAFEIASSGSADAGAALLPPPEDGSDAAETEATADAAAPAAAAPAAEASSSSGESTMAEGEKVVKCGYVRINKSVGLVQMRGPRAVLDQANEVIRRVQDIASRRILLEARVLAVTRRRNFDQKSKIGAGFGNPGENDNFGIATQGSITATIADEIASLTDSSTGTGGFIYNSKNLDAVVSLLERFGTTYELMHPMLELMDRQRATLIDGRNEKYFIVQTTTDSETNSTSSGVQERNQFLGLQFSAAAQVSADADTPHTISLQIPITSQAGTVAIPLGDASGSTAGVAPIANTRLIDQKVRVRDGEIKVIGGLTKTLAVDTEKGIPLLREIPAFGKLANEESISYEQVEFVVLLQVRRLD